MPFASVEQQRFLEAHPEKLKGKIHEWEGATDFSKLPAYVRDGHSTKKNHRKPRQRKAS